MNTTYLRGKTESCWNPTDLKGVPILYSQTGEISGLALHILLKQVVILGRGFQQQQQKGYN